MMNQAQIAILAAITASVFAALVVPGPSSITVMRASLTAGARCGLATATGVALSNSFYATAAAFGLAMVIREAAPLMIAIKLLGGAYLIYLGLRLILSEKHTDLPIGRQKPMSLRYAFRRGLLTDLSNPKTMMAFLGIFAIAFPTHPTHELSVAVVAVIACLSLSWHCLLAGLFARPTLRRAYQGFSRWIDRLAGGLISAFGAAIAATSA
ncbi:LysE family transporter [Dongia soli]|uniref:LysE family transporter n=1 Tax=Dongia soli TaxID=600628 RepID=A0ABU5ED53_9PROT|nr:LysE family transporter [Dongia soli]MDY0884279.1 LysE family transporter [Dongia soli]